MRSKALTEAQARYRQSVKGKEAYAKSKRKHRYKSMYGIAVMDYESMYIAQHGVCAICHRPEYKYKYLHVDHDHTTGKIRGLLCHKCNKALGLLEDNKDSLKRALEYL